MFKTRRVLKKNRQRNKAKAIFYSLILISVLLLVGGYFFLNFSFGRKVFISPIAKENISKLSLIESALDKKKISFKTVDVSSDGSVIINLSDEGKVILSPAKDLTEQLSSLQLILARLTIEGNKLKSLDFRYDNPVVSF